MDPRAAIEIKNKGLEKFLDSCNEDDRMFLGGDKKNYGLCNEIKMPSSRHYRNVYVTITNFQVFLFMRFCYV